MNPSTKMSSHVGWRRQWRYTLHFTVPGRTMPGRRTDLSGATPYIASAQQVLGSFGQDHRGPVSRKISPSLSPAGQTMCLTRYGHTTRENPSSSAGFEASSSAGCRATNKALQLTHSSSAALTRATTVDDINSAFQERATIN